jgi:glutamine---fructose-6-phosphate transaminase (isomerizing)
MGGIFGYIGKKTNAPEIVLQGLKRLDYRGYDSWGIAVANHEMHCIKDVGKVSEITDLPLPDATVAIAHTRWATTGAVTKNNAHPHVSSDKTFALAQNGIVENFEELKSILIKKGYAFITETDTEVIVRLIEDNLKNTDMKSAIRQAFGMIKGRNTIILLTVSGEIYAARNGSPLVIGINRDSHEYYISSDTLSFASLAHEMVVVENGQLIEVSDDLSIFDMATGQNVTYAPEKITIVDEKIDKRGFDHFMLKEI